MRKIIQISLFLFTLILCKPLFSQVIWEENFEIPDQGFWGNEVNGLQNDLSNVYWFLDVDGCEFSDDNDYAKTVTTGGGRFEVLDSDGEVTWSSPLIQIATYDAVSVSLLAGETGSSSVVEKKYLKAFVRIDGGQKIPFEPVYTATGNWGSLVLSQSGIVGSNLQLIVQMNSSYANDKVYLDQIMVEAIDSSSLKADEIKMMSVSPLVFTEDTIDMRAVVLNKLGEKMSDSTILLNFESTQLKTISYNYNEGVYSWMVVPQTSGILTYAVVDVSDQLGRVDSSLTCFLKEDAFLIEDFESTPSAEWNFMGDWVLSDVEPISGDYSVKHIEKEEGGTSILTYNGDGFSLSEAEYLFSFQLKNGDWDPSSSNSFYFWITGVDESSTVNGYVIGVNADGSSDLLSLWVVVNGVVDELIAETAFDWGEETVAQIDVVRSVLGEWVLNVTDINSGEVCTSMGQNDDYTEIDEFGLTFNYTASRSGGLCFDNLFVISQNAAPFILDAVALSDGRFKITFNEDIQMDLIDVSNFKLIGESGTEYTLESIEKVGFSEVILSAGTVVEPYLVVQVSSITDADGLISDNLDFDLENVLPAGIADVVFSEIMADPNPPVKLPLAEYLEIYNRSNHYIQLENWTLFVRNTVFTLPARLMEPGTYLLLCDEDFLTDFSVKGEVLALESFPALLNSGSNISLVNADGLVVESIAYSDDWYQSDEKDGGGYSIERIDLNRLCGQSQNWIASDDLSGGTPSFVNSVDAVNTDDAAPQLLGVDVVSYTELLVHFDEALDTIAAEDVANYAIEGLSLLSIEYFAGDFDVKITLKQPLQINTEYQLVVDQMVDECGNRSDPMELPFSSLLLEGGDVLINEVLFNPFTNGVDFVELYNNSGFNIDLTALKLANRDDLLELNPVYDVSEQNIIFPDQSIIVLTTDASNIMENYEVPYPERLIEVDKMPSFNNDEGRVVVLGDSLQVLDELAYNETMHDEWLSVVDGVSLERMSLDGETNLESNWHSASSLVGYASPTYANSQNAIEEQQQNSVELESDVVSPNGDGFNDALLIRFLIDRPGYMANVLVFNASGREVKRITNNDLIGDQLELSYDLRDGNGALLPMGMYVLFTELLHSDGEKAVFKNAFLVTDKQ